MNPTDVHEPTTAADTEAYAAAPVVPISRSRRWARRLALVVALVIAAGAGAWLGLQWLTPHPYSGTVMQAPTAAPSMDGLRYSDGTPVELGDFDGDLLLVYFGYTSCPDVCPTTLSQVARARARLGGDADRVHLLLVSIDPERDALDQLDDYVESFDPSFLGASGDPDAIERVAALYGVFFAKGEALGDGYTMDHTATLMGIDGEGRLRIVWPGVLDVERLADDLRELL